MFLCVFGFMAIPTICPYADLVDSARAQIGKTLIYDGAYAALKYPCGDVPLIKGVCSDVAIRALRAQGIDLQQEVYKSISQNKSAYIKCLTHGRPDKNIDHRRVKVLAVYFTLSGWRQKTTTKASAKISTYQPGDILVFDFGNGLWHIAIVSDKVADAKRPYIIHNVGQGTREEDFLGRFPVLFCFRKPRC